MIQRIQTLYLILASGLLFALLAVPFLVTMPMPLDPALKDGDFDVFDNPGLLGLSVLGGLATLATVFVFRNRRLQGRMAGALLVVSILLIALETFSVYRTLSATAIHIPQWQAGIGLAPLAAVLQVLARRAIRRDENLVRSIDRLR